jgi:hypothetical protein
MRIGIGFFVFFVFFAVFVACLGIPEISNMVSTLDNSLKAALCTAIVAVLVVVFSQWRFDERQRKQHEHDLKLKLDEKLTDKKEQLANQIMLANTEILTLMPHAQEANDNRLVQGNKETIAPYLKIKYEIYEKIDKSQCLIELYFPSLSTEIAVLKSTAATYIIVCDEISTGNRKVFESTFKSKYEPVNKVVVGLYSSILKLNTISESEKQISN